ncbi:MAG: response regulator [Nitrospirae bacterium]|nr:response regulator [Nitrospirota bacterium]
MGKRILVADSDGVVQQVASYFLKLEGFEVEAVGDGVSAMEAIDKFVPDVIVVNPSLPGINGVEVSQFIRENPKYRSIPIIFLAESEEPLLNKISEVSLDYGIVNKPIDPTRLVNTLKEYLEKEAVPPEEVKESLKNIEELLGWEVSEKKASEIKEDVIEENIQAGSFDVTEMLTGIINVPEMENAMNEETLCADETVMCPMTSEHAETETAVDVKEHDDRPGQPDEHEKAAPAFMYSIENVEAEVKSRITDEMIETMVRKIAADVAERVVREILPDIAEREILKEIERLKGTE